MFDKIASAIAEQLNIDKATITLQSRLMEDLKADSLDLVAMVMELEQEHDVQISDEDMMSLRTVGDIVTYLEAKA